MSCGQDGNSGPGSRGTGGISPKLKKTKICP